MAFVNQLFPDDEEMARDPLAERAAGGGGVRGRRRDIAGGLDGKGRAAGYRGTGTRHGRFGAPPALGGIAVAVVALGGFLAAEGDAVRPLLDLGWSGAGSSAAANAGAGLFALGLYLQQGEGPAPRSWARSRPTRLPLATLTPFTGRLVARVSPRLPAGLGLMASGAGYLGTVLVVSASIDSPIGWPFLALAGAGMGVAVPGLVALIGGLSATPPPSPSAPARSPSAASSPSR